MKNLKNKIKKFLTNLNDEWSLYVYYKEREGEIPTRIKFIRENYLHNWRQDIVGWAICKLVGHKKKDEPQSSHYHGYYCHRCGTYHS